MPDATRMNDDINYDKKLIYEWLVEDARKRQKEVEAKYAANPIYPIVLLNGRIISGTKGKKKCPNPKT